MFFSEFKNEIKIYIKVQSKDSQIKQSEYIIFITIQTNFKFKD